MIVAFGKRDQRNYRTRTAASFGRLSKTPHDALSTMAANHSAAGGRHETL